MRQYYLISLIYIIPLLFTTGCTNSPVSENEVKAEEDNLIQISADQFNSNNLKVGELTTQLFEEFVTCNGYIKASPSGMAQLSTQISGIVESINCAPGDYVKKGEVLCSLSSTELIVLQQGFAETSANLKRLKADWERSKALYDEKIGAEKDYISIENEYKIELAKHQSLKLRLELLNLDVSKIENGELYSSLSILAPISGYVTSQNIILGEFIEIQKNLLEIVDINQLQLQLAVFENNIRNVKVGQNIQFYSLGEKRALYNATLISIGKTIDKETKTIQCLAKIENSETFNKINNTYIEAKIIVAQMEAKALPNEAILISGNDYYVLVIDKSDDQNYYLRKANVKIGQRSKGYTEIIDGDGLTNVITQGVYNIIAD